MLVSDTSLSDKWGFSFLASVTVDNRKYILNLFDSAGQVKFHAFELEHFVFFQEEYDQLRIMAYPNTNVFILCFSVVDPDSYSNILSKWIPELNRKYSADLELLDYCL